MISTAAGQHWNPLRRWIWVRFICLLRASLRRHGFWCCWWWYFGDDMCYMLHVDDFWGMVPKVHFNFCNCEICGKQGQRFRRISLRAIEWIFFKDPEGGVGREAAPSEELFFPNQAVQGWIAMMASAKDHEISRKWAKNWCVPPKNTLW